MIKEQYRSTIMDTTLSIVNSQLESVRNKNITKTSQRVYKDGFIGVAGAIGTFSEDELLNEAQQALGKNIEYPIDPSAQQTMSHDVRQPIIAAHEVLDEFNLLLEDLKKRQPHFIFSNKISLTEVKSSLVNDAGLQLDYTDRCLSSGIIFKEKTSTSVFDGGLGFLERKYDRKLILDEFDLILNAYREKVELPKKGRCPIIFVTEEAPVDKFVSDLKADVFAQGGSLFSDKLGQKLFNESFTFGQNLNPADVMNTPFFDAEGTVNPHFVFNLIEDGILKAPYCDKKTAHKYGFKSSGGAVAPYDGVPQSSIIRPYIKKTAESLKALLGGEMGIFVFMASGGDFTPQGDYATPVQLAMLFDGERLIGRLPEFNLSSSVFDMFGEGFRGVASNGFLPFSTNEFVVLEMNIS